MQNNDNSVWTSTQKSVHGAGNMEYRMFAKEWKSGTEIVQACLDLGVLGQVCEIARNRGRASAGRVLAERCCMKSTWFTNESKTISAELPSAAARGAVETKSVNIKCKPEFKIQRKNGKQYFRRFPSMSVDFRRVSSIFMDFRRGVASSGPPRT